MKLVPLDQLPEGARRIHLGYLENALAPRGVFRPDGNFEKESLAGSIYDSVRMTAESWSNPEYADSRPASEVAEELILQMEVQMGHVAQKLREWAANQAPDHTTT